MTATASDILRLRAMIDEPTGDTYDDEALAEIIERYPLTDERGVDPYWIDTSTEPPQQVETTGWLPTYDLAAAAAEIWQRKASAAVSDIDMPHEDRNYRYSQRYDQYMRQARFYEARRSAKSAVLIASPSPNRRGTGSSVVGNLAEED